MVSFYFNFMFHSPSMRFFPFRASFSLHNLKNNFCTIVGRADAESAVAVASQRIISVEFGGCLGDPTRPCSIFELILLPWGIYYSIIVSSNL